MLKKFLALALAGAMVIGSMSLTAFADNAAVDAGSYDEKVSITGLKAGDTVKLYKLVEWVNDATDNVKGWKATSDYATYLDKAKLTAILLGDATATPAVLPGITSDIAGDLSKLATNATLVATIPATASTVEFDVTADPAKYGPGMYMALVTPADADDVYNPVFVSSDFNKDEAGTIAMSETYTNPPDATVKSSTSHVDKEAKTSEQIWADQKWNTTAIGDTVEFTVKTTIPGYGDVYENPYFALADKLTDLDLILDSVTVTDPTGLTKGNQYKVTGGTDNYKLEFDKAYLKTIKVPTEVTVTYSAIVSTDAPVSYNTEKNEISTIFSHIPSSEDDYAFKKDTTQHYTFTIDASGLGGHSDQEGRKTSEIVKVGQNPDGSWITSEKVFSEVDPRHYYQGELQNAEFKLYTDSTCKNEYRRKDKTGADIGPFQLTSGSDGRFEIKGLDAGTYYLLETKAPAGYVKDTKVHTIEITTDYYTDQDVTEWTTDGENWIPDSHYQALANKDGYKSYTFKTDVLKSYTIKIDGKETAHYNFDRYGTDAEINWTVNPPVEIPSSIINTKGVELPSTGGIGTTLFYAGGAILVLLAGILLVSKRRIA